MHYSLIPKNHNQNYEQKPENLIIEVQCETENFTPMKFFECYFSKTEHFKAALYVHIWRSNLCQIKNFHSIILKFAILCALTQRIFRFHLKAYCMDLIVKYSDCQFQPLDY